MAGTGLASAGQREIDVDADNLVAGNPRYTVTLYGLSAGEIDEVTVTVGGVAFAAVEILARDPAVLAVDASNLAEAESIRSRDVVEVAVWVGTGDEEFAGTDRSQVIVD